MSSSSPADYSNIPVGTMPVVHLVVISGKEDYVEQIGLQKAKEKLQKWFESTCKEIEKMKILVSFDELQNEEKMGA